MELTLIAVLLILFQLVPNTFGFPAAMDLILESNKNELNNFLEGDVLKVKKRNAVTDENHNEKWQNGNVPYTFHSSISITNRQIVRSALQLITNAANCITFTEYQSNIPVDHIEVVLGSACTSYVGKNGGRQQISLTEGCMTSGIIIHEFLHALGFHHEQSRPDRDQFVKINNKNIRADGKDNFLIESTVNSLGVAYDPDSIMHYGRTAFSSNGQPTIVWLQDPNRNLGGEQLTHKDIQQLNLLYCGITITTVQPPPVTTTQRPSGCTGSFCSGSVNQFNAFGSGCQNLDDNTCEHEFWDCQSMREFSQIACRKTCGLC